MMPLTSRNGGDNTKSVSSSSSQSAADVSSSTLTPLQLQRVNESFHKLYGYPFSTSSSTFLTTNQESSVPTAVSSSPPPPDWLYTILGNHSRPAQRVWNQLSPTQQQQWTRRQWRRHTTTTTTTTIQQHSKRRKVDHQDTLYYDRMKSHQELLASNHQTTNPLVVNTSQYDFKNATTVAPTQSSTTSATNMTTRTNNNNNDNIPTTKTTKNNLTSLLQQLDGHHKVTTMTKTAMDWEQYKQQQPLSLQETLEGQATSSTAYLPKQEFLQRVDLRKYQQEQQERLLSQGGKK